MWKRRNIVLRGDFFQVLRERKKESEREGERERERERERYMKREREKEGEHIVLRGIFNRSPIVLKWLKKCKVSITKTHGWFKLF